MGLKVCKFDFGVWSLNAKQTLMILSFFHTLIYVIYCASAQRVENERHTVVPNAPNNNHITSWDVQNSDKNAALYSNLIDILEKLNIVQGGDNPSSCVSLGKVVREVEDAQLDDMSKTIKVTFHLTDTQHSIVSKESAQNDNSSQDKSSQDKNVPGYSIGGVKSPRCNKSSSFLTKGLDSLSRKQDDKDTGAKAVLDVDVGGDVNGTGAVSLALEPKNGIEKEEEKGKR